jgi:hypothetical protein
VKLTIALLVLALLPGCSCQGPQATGAPSSAPSEKPIPLQARADVFRGVYLITNPDAEAYQRDMAAQIAAEKDPQRAEMLRGTARLNAEFMRTEATLRAGRLRLKRAETLLFEANYQVVEADAQSVTLAFPDPSTPDSAPHLSIQSLRLERISLTELRVPALEQQLGSSAWIRQQTRD